MNEFYGCCIIWNLIKKEKKLYELFWKIVEWKGRKRGKYTVSEEIFIFIWCML